MILQNHFSIKDWFSEVKDWPASYTSAYQSTAAQTGHYTQVDRKKIVPNSVVESFMSFVQGCVGQDLQSWLWIHRMEERASIRCPISLPPGQKFNCS